MLRHHLHVRWRTLQLLNFTNKNSDGMDLIMWLGSLGCGLSWLTYGVMVDDVAIYVRTEHDSLLQLTCIHTFMKAIYTS